MSICRSRLSLVIPVYNEEDIIADCLEHVAAQIQPFDEVIVVDNSCTDRTMEIVRTFADRIPLELVTETTPGVGPARRAGFDAATGDILGRIDADTWLDSQWAGRVRRSFVADPATDAVSGPLYWYDTPIDNRVRKLVRREAARSLRSRSITGVELRGANMAIRKEAWHAAKPHLLDAPGTHEDIDLYCALVKAGGHVKHLAYLIAAQSARRFAEPVSSNLAYVRGTIRTVRMHGNRAETQRLLGMLPVNAVFLFCMRVIVGPFDPAERKWRPFRYRRVRRISPMEGTREPVLLAGLKTGD